MTQNINIFPNTSSNPYAKHPFTPSFVVPSKPTLGESFKPKRAGSKSSHVIFVLDDSGSMFSTRDKTISGFNEYLDSQKKDAETSGIKTSVSLYKFDGSNVNCVYDHVDVSEAKHLDHDSYNPKGMTNLLDAMGAVMIKINEQLIKVKKSERESIIVSILTDGGENSSQVFRSDDVKVMKTKAEDKNWGFMFLGANIDAFATSAQFGFTRENTLQFNNVNSDETIKAASAMTTRMKSAYNLGMATSDTYTTSAFTDQERSVSVGESVVK